MRLQTLASIRNVLTTMNETRCLPCAGTDAILDRKLGVISFSTEALNDSEAVSERLINSDSGLFSPLLHQHHQNTQLSFDELNARLLSSVVFVMNADSDSLEHLEITLVPEHLIDCFRPLTLGNYYQTKLINVSAETFSFDCISDDCSQRELRIPDYSEAFKTWFSDQTKQVYLKLVPLPCDFDHENTYKESINSTPSRAPASMFKGINNPTNTPPSAKFT